MDDTIERVAKAAIEAMEDNPHVRIATMTPEEGNLITIHVDARGSSVIVKRGNKEACFEALLSYFLSSVYEEKQWDCEEATRYVAKICQDIIGNFIEENQ